MKALDNRMKRAEEMARKNHSRVIDNLAKRKFFEALKKSPQWLTDVYAFFYAFCGNVYLFAENNHPGITGQALGLKGFHKRYLFLPQRVEEILWDYPARGEITKQVVRRLFLIVIEKSPKLTEGLRQKFLDTTSEQHALLQQFFFPYLLVY